MQNYNQRPGGAFKKNIVGIFVFGVFLLVICGLRTIVFNGIKSCKDDGTAIVVDIDYSTSSDGDDMYTYTYLIDGYTIKAKVATNREYNMMDEVHVYYNVEKDLVYTDFEHTIYTAMCWASYVIIALIAWNAVLLVIKIVALLGVAGVMIHTNNEQNRQELEQWQQMNSMNGMGNGINNTYDMNGNSMNSGSYNLNGYDSSGMNVNMGMDNDNGNGQFIFGNMSNNQNEQEQNDYSQDTYGQNGYEQNGYNEQNEYNYNNQQYQ